MLYKLYVVLDNLILFRQLKQQMISCAFVVLPFTVFLTVKIQKAISCIILSTKIMLTQFKKKKNKLFFQAWKSILLLSHFSRVGVVSICLKH